MSIQAAVVINYSTYVPAYKKDNLTSYPSAIYNRKAQLLDNCIASNQEWKEKDNMEIASMPLVDYLTNYYISVSYQVRESTHQQRLVYIASLSHYDIAHKPIAEIKRADVRIAVAEMAKTLARTTLGHIISLLRVALNEAVEEDIIRLNPAIGVKMPNKANIKPAKIVQPYTREEQAAFTAECEKSKHDAGAANILLLETGLRIGELLALEFEDVDFEKGTLTVNKTLVCNNLRNAPIQEPKTPSSRRTIPLSSKAVEVFRKLKEKNGDKGYWFTCREGRLTYSSCTSATKTICKRAGIEYRGEHVLRHTCATNKVQEHAPITTVSRFLGHANTIITQQVYVSVYSTSVDDMRQIVH